MRRAWGTGGIELVFAMGVSKCIADYLFCFKTITEFRIRNIIFPLTSSHLSVRVSSPAPGLHYPIIIRSVNRVTVAFNTRSINPMPSDFRQVDNT